MNQPHMHIVQIIATLERAAAGPTASVRRLAEALAERGVKSEVLSLGAPSDQLSGRARSHVLSADRSRLPGISSLLPSRELARAIEEAARAGAVLHGHGLWRMPNIYPARASRRHGVPLVVSPRGMLSKPALRFSRWPKRAFWHTLQKQALEAATCFHATSAAEADDIRAAGFAQPIAIIPNGIDVPPEAEVAAAKFGRRPDAQRTLLYLGRLHPIKRIDHLLEAWSRLEAHFPSWRLRIVGPSEGTHGAELKELAARLRIRSVTFEPGAFNEAKDRAYRTADLLVLASESENFGMVVAEALGNGTPVITTKGTPWRGLQEEACGWWIDHGVEPLVAALAEAMAISRPALDRLGRQGFEWMTKDFSWSHVAEDMQSVYFWITGQSEKPSVVQ